MRRPKDRWIAALVALAGAGLCIAAIIHFLMTMLYNRLPRGTEAHPVRDHYLVVGSFYSQGFIVGFFFCLSLAMLAVVLASWRDAARRTLPEIETGDFADEFGHPERVYGSEELH